MKYSYFIFVICLISISKTERLSTINKEKSMNSSFIIYSQNLNNKHLKGSSGDVNVDNLYIYENKNGYTYYATGYAKIYNSYSYKTFRCGFSTGIPTQNEINRFDSTTITPEYYYTTITVNIGSNNKDNDYFSCYACDSKYCYGWNISFSPSEESSLSSTTLILIIVGSIVGFIVLILICCCCCCIIYRSKTSITSRNSNAPVVSGIPVSNNVNYDTSANPVVVSNAMNQNPITINTPVSNNVKYNANTNHVVVASNIIPNSIANTTPVYNSVNVNPVSPLENQVVYAIQNPDGSFEYYTTNPAVIVNSYQ